MSTSLRTLAGGRSSLRRTPSSAVAASAACPLEIASTATTAASNAARNSSSFSPSPRNSPGTICKRVASHAQSRTATVRACGARNSQRSRALSAASPSMISCKLCPLSSTRRLCPSTARRSAVFSAPSPRASACTFCSATVARRRSPTNALSATARLSSKSPRALKISPFATHCASICTALCSPVGLPSFASAARSSGVSLSSFATAACAASSWSTPSHAVSTCSARSACVPATASARFTVTGLRTGNGRPPTFLTFVAMTCPASCCLRLKASFALTAVPLVKASSAFLNFGVPVPASSSRPIFSPSRAKASCIRLASSAVGPP